MEAAERESSELRALLRAIDHRPPSLSADSIVARASSRSLAWGRLAAGLLLSVTLAGAAYAAPGSPVPGWVAAVGRAIAGSPPSPPTPAPPPPLPAPELAGIAISAGSPLSIVFAAAQREGTVEIVLTDGVDILVRVPAGGATFTSEAYRLLIGNRGSSASYRIEIPRSAPRVEVLIQGIRLFLKDGSRITVDSSSGSLDSWSLSLGDHLP